MSIDVVSHMLNSYRNFNPAKLRNYSPALTDAISGSIDQRKKYIELKPNFRLFKRIYAFPQIYEVR